MNSSESAEAIVKMTLEGIEVAAKITGSGAKNFAVLLYTILKDNTKTKGKVKLNTMLKSGSPLNIFSLKEDQLDKFNKEAKRYGVLYTALMDRKHKNNDGMVDIMVRAEDAAKVNRIVERFNLVSINVASIKSELEKENIDKMIHEAKEKGVEIKSVEERLADDILSKPIQKEESESSNPKMAVAEKSPLSEPLSENKNNLWVNSKDKSSVREELNKIKNELKEQKEQQIDNLEKNILNENHNNIKETKHIPPKKKKEKEKVK